MTAPAVTATPDRSSTTGPPNDIISSPPTSSSMRWCWCSISTNQYCHRRLTPSLVSRRVRYVELVIENLFHFCRSLFLLCASVVVVVFWEGAVATVVARVFFGIGRRRERLRWRVTCRRVPHLLSPPRQSASSSRPRPGSPSKCRDKKRELFEPVIKNKTRTFTIMMLTTRHSMIAIKVSFHPLVQQKGDGGD
jgi:hypothetical protein